MKFISFRIASKGYTVYNMSPMTATRIMQAIDTDKKMEKDGACVAAMAKSIALAIVGSRAMFRKIKTLLLKYRLMKKGSLDELFKAYHKVLLMLPLEDIAAVRSVMEQLSVTISQDHE